MVLEFGTREERQVDVHYVNAPMSCVVEANFGEYYFDDLDDLALAEELQNQEGLYQSFQRNAQQGMHEASSSTDPKLNNGRIAGESSRTSICVTQLAIDEALARELQELETQLHDTSLGDNAEAESSKDHITSSQSAQANGGHNSVNRSSQVAWEGGIDPDSMSYEELQQLGEAIGTQSKGLTDDVIALLETDTYRTSLFSRKDKHEECIICCQNFKNRDKLIRLPCHHQYHGHCVTKWLRINKVCPVCYKEVFGS